MEDIEIQKPLSASASKLESLVARLASLSKEVVVLKASCVFNEHARHHIQLLEIRQELHKYEYDSYTSQKLVGIQSVSKLI